MNNNNISLDSQPPAEQIVFRRDNTKGIFHKRIVSRDIITNRRIIHSTTDRSPESLLQDLDDVLTMNSTGQSNNYQYLGTSIASNLQRNSNRVK